MHELSLASAILEIAIRRSDGRSISVVRVDVGVLRQASPSALEFGFEALSAGTTAHGARLEIRPVGARGRCEECGACSALFGFPILCPRCGSQRVDIIAGEELMVTSLDVEDPDGA